jgi:hypothetical protein
MICIQLKIKCKTILLKTLENGLNKSYFMTYQHPHPLIYLKKKKISQSNFYIFGENGISLRIKKVVQHNKGVTTTGVWNVSNIRQKLAYNKSRWNYK